MSEYTPTPWEVYTVKDQYPGVEALNGTFSIVVWGDSKIESDCGVQGRTPEEANANAEFIVRAVNSHEALVEALEVCLDRLEGEVTLDLIPATHSTLACVRAALELVGGGEAVSEHIHDYSLRDDGMCCHCGLPEPEMPKCSEHEECDGPVCSMPGFRVIENGECGAQLEIKDAELRRSMARNIAYALVRAKAEGAAEERAKHQADCEKALLEMEESAMQRERERVLRQVWFELKAALGKGEPQQILNKTIDAIRARGEKP